MTVVIDDSQESAVCIVTRVAGRTVYLQEIDGPLVDAPMRMQYTYKDSGGAMTVEDKVGDVYLVSITPLVIRRS